VTAGENISDLKGESSKEAWLYATYGKGIEDVMQRTPDRSILLIHRMNQANLKEIIA